MTHEAVMQDSMACDDAQHSCIVKGCSGVLRCCLSEYVCLICRSAPWLFWWCSLLGKSLLSTTCSCKLYVVVVCMFRWEPCSDVLHYKHTAGSMIHIHRELTAQYGLRGLILSGDHDYVIPFTGTRDWVYSLGFKVDQPWHAWHTKQRQVGALISSFAGPCVVIAACICGTCLAA